MSDQTPLSSCDWPIWTWQKSDWWIAVVGLVIAIIPYLDPSYDHIPLNIRIVSVPLCCLALLFISHMCRCGRVALIRIRTYAILYRLCIDKNDEVENAKVVIGYLVEKLDQSERYKIDGGFYFKERVFLSIRIAKWDNHSRMGMRFNVVDTLDGDLLGLFEITSISDTHCSASHVTIDPLWLGYIVQSAKVDVPPHIIAIAAEGGRAT